jgi:hypothetical protein
MSSKYRVLEKEGQFFPQWKFLCFWFYWEVHPEYGGRRYFKTLNEAKEFISEYLKPEIVKEHNYP